MARRRIQFQYIRDRNARKASLKKRRAGLIKKVYELCTLCGVQGCVIIYEPESDVPVTWPPIRDEVEHVLQRFLNTSELERCKKTMDHEAYLLDMANKIQNQLFDVQKGNRMTECDLLMHQLFTHGRPFDTLNVLEMGALSWFMEQRMNEVQRRIQSLQFSGPPESPPAPLSGQPENLEVGQSSGGNMNSGNDIMRQDAETWMQTLVRNSGSNPNMLQYSNVVARSNPNILQYSTVAGYGNNNFQQPGAYGSVNMQNLTAVGYGNNTVLHQSIPDNSNNAFVLPPTGPGYNNGNTFQAIGAAGYGNNAVLQGNPNNQNSSNLQRASLECLIGAGTGMANNNMGFINDPYAVINNTSNNNIMLPVPYASAPIRNAGNNGYPMGNPQQGGTLGYQMGLPQQGGSIGYPVGIQQGGGLRYSMGMRAQGCGGMGYLAALFAPDPENAINAIGMPGGSAELEMGMSAQGGVGNMEHGIWFQQQGYYAGENPSIQVNMNVQNAAIGTPEARSNNFGRDVAPEGYYPGENSAAAAPVTTSSGGNATVDHENEEGTGLYQANSGTSFY